MDVEEDVRKASSKERHELQSECLPVAVVEGHVLRRAMTAMSIA